MTTSTFESDKKHDQLIAVKASVLQDEKFESCEIDNKLI